MIEPKLILASASPRRQRLLREAGYEFIVHPADVDEESIGRNLDPILAVGRIAKAKADAVAALFPHDFILAADTIVELDGKMLGKAADIGHAREMLKSLSGSTHRVITAVVIRRMQPCITIGNAVHSTVQMRQLTDPEIEAYLATNQWQGKAGSYGIQDADPFVTRISGCATNIVGLPMTTTKKMLEDVGIYPTRI